MSFLWDCLFLGARYVKFPGQAVSFRGVVTPPSHPVWGRSFCDQGHHFAAHFLDLSGETTIRNADMEWKPGTFLIRCGYKLVQSHSILHIYIYYVLWLLYIIVYPNWTIYSSILYYIVQYSRLFSQYRNDRFETDPGHQPYPLWRTGIVEN